jgi:signal transduction histidine kinase
MFSEWTVSKPQQLSKARRMFDTLSDGRDCKVEEEIPHGGIGQTISRTIIEVHGGRLWAT